MKSYITFLFSFFVFYAAKTQPLTFSENIAPVIHSKCTSCHRPGEIGPFSLITYKDVITHQKQINYVIENKIMPPWKADPGYSHYANELILKDSEIKLIQQWISEGSKEGKKIPRENLIKLTATNVSEFGDDYIDIKMPVNYVVKGDNDDYVVQFIVPMELDDEHQVSNIQFIPGNRKAIHHANYKIVSYNEIYDKRIKPVVLNYPHTAFGDEKFDEPFQAPDILYYGGWLPGASPMNWEEGCGFMLPGKFYVQFKIHYAPTPVDLQDQSMIRLYFSNSALKDTVRFINVGSFGGLAEPTPLLVLPPDTQLKFIAYYQLPDSLNLMYFVPHMHLLGKSFWAYATSPSGDTIPLIKINEWDFNWQEFYRFSPPLILPKGYSIYIEGVFDNTVSNRNNHFNPAKWITQGVGTYDEMLSMVMIFY